jgi:hypothetical protein
MADKRKLLGSTTKAPTQKAQPGTILGQKTTKGRTYQNLSLSVLTDDITYLDGLAELIKNDMGIAINARSIVGRAAINALRREMEQFTEEERARRIIELAAPTPNK